MDESSTSNISAPQTRQKRILPSRTKRGGPGVGSCDVDVMILETKRRQVENEPLIPGTTKFLLTTNATMASSSSNDTGAMKFNVHANERYFDKPEVLQAYREQLVIETPEYVSLGNVPNAGRLRARSQTGITEDGPPETSDFAYEKRHRKYEIFEKRLRLREKEKLKHEQYKLKERIEQLRLMDSSAFLTLPASHFSGPLAQSHDVDDDFSDAQYPNGPNVNKEGERRRKEMLDIAYMLEERYRILLPPERGKKVTPVDTTIDMPAPIVTGRVRHDTQLDEEQHAVGPPTEVNGGTIKVKINGRIPLPSRRGRKSGPLKNLTARKTKIIPVDRIVPQEEIVQSEETHGHEGDALEDAGQADEMFEVEGMVTEQHSEAMITDHLITAKEGSQIEEGPIQSTSPTEGEQAGQDSRPEDDEHDKEVVQLESSAYHSEVRSSLQVGPPFRSCTPPEVIMQPVSELEPFQRSRSRSGTPMSTPAIATLENEPFDSAYFDDVSHASPVETQGGPSKRRRLSLDPLLEQGIPKDESLGPSESISTRAKRTGPRLPKQMILYKDSETGEQERTCSSLLISAIRSSGNSSRKGKRNVTAFGVKLSNWLFQEIRDFELPGWVHGSKKPEDGIDAEMPGFRMISVPAETPEGE